MENLNPQQTNSYISPEDDKRNDFLPIVMKSLHVFAANWKWFLLSATVCVLLAYLYQAKLPRVYERSSTIAVKNNDNNSNSRNASAAMMLNGINANGELKDEAFILKSHRLMRKVAQNLNLDVDYTTDLGLRKYSLYKESPVKITFFKPFSQNLNFDIDIESDQSFRIHNLKTNGNLSDFDQTATFGKAMETPFGAILVEKNKSTFARYMKRTINVGRISKEQAAMRFTGCINAQVKDQSSNLIFVSCHDTNVKRADDILATLLEAYKNDIVENKNKQSMNADKFLTQRIMLIGNDLNSTENRMASFKQTNDVIDFDKNASIYLDQSNQANQQVMKLESEKNVGLFLRDYLRQQNDGNYEVIPSIGDIDNSGLESGISQYNELVMNYNRLSSNAGSASPVVRDALERLKSTHSVITKTVENYINTVNVKLRQANSVKNSITSSISSVPQKQKSASDIERQRKIKEDIYVYLLNKREEVALQLAVTEANVNIIETPYGYASPIYPKSGRILLIGLAIGLAIPTAIFWLIMQLDTKVRYRKEVEDGCSAPILGDIPLWKEDDENNKFIDRSHGGMNYNAVSEALRMLRYNLNFMKKRSKVMMITSSTPGSGKSFVSRNLALILGISGKKVILVDGDIRKRTQSKIISGNDGLTTYLNDDTCNLDSLIKRDGVGKNVDFLPAGLTPPNPTELLMSPRLEELTDELKSRYDYVIYDTTPAISVADAGIINRVTELTLYVIRIGVEDKRFLAEIDKMYKTKKFRNLAIIINGSVRSKYGYGYGYGYSYGYGYGYGYGEERGKSHKHSGKSGSSKTAATAAPVRKPSVNNNRIDVNQLRDASKDDSKE